MIQQDTLLYKLRQRKIEKNVCPFFLESPRPFFPSLGLWTPFSSLGILDFLSTYLGIDSEYTCVCVCVCVCVCMCVYAYVEI